MEEAGLGAIESHPQRAHNLFRSDAGPDCLLPVDTDLCVVRGLFDVPVNVDDAVGRWTLARLGNDRSVLDGFRPPAPDVPAFDAHSAGEASS